MGTWVSLSMSRRRRQIWSQRCCVASGLRSRCIAAAVHPPDGAPAYARAWHFTHLVSRAGEERIVLRRLDGSSAAPPEVEVESLGALVRAIGRFS